MEEEVSKLQKCLQEKDEQLRSSTSSTEQVKISLNPPFEFTQIFQLELSQPNMALPAISWRYGHINWTSGHGLVLCLFVLF